MGRKNKCIVCGVNLDSTNTTWYRQKNHVHKCNDCSRKEKRDWAREARKRDPTIQAERSYRHNKRLRENDPKKYTARQMCSSARKRAKALDLPYDIDSEYVDSISPELCPVFCTPLKYGGGEKSKHSASIDRIIPKDGYVRGNVMVMSLLANTMKNEATAGELLIFANWVLSNELGE